MSLFLLMSAHNETIPGRLDIVKSYTMTTKRGNPDDVRNWFNSNWLTSQCEIATTLTADCKTARVALREKAKVLMECDKYGSPACTCVAKAVSGLAYGTSDGSGKDLSTKKDTIITAIYDCVDTFQNSALAKQTVQTWFLRSGIHLMLATLLFFQILFNTMLNPYVASMEAGFWHTVGWWASRIFLFFGPIIAYGINMAFLPQTVVFMSLITLVPVVLLIWFEGLLPDDIHKPWIHPYYFPIFLSCFSLLSLIENGVLNYQNIIVEFLKAQAISYLYLATVWIYSYNQECTVSSSDSDVTKELLLTRPVNEAHYLTVMLAGFVQFNSQFAPYSTNGFSLFLWCVPFLFVLISFGSLTWIASLKLSSFYGESKGKDDLGPQDVTENDEAISFLLIVLVAAVALMFLAEHASVYRAFFDKIPEYNSINFDYRLIGALGTGYRSIVA